MVVTGPRFPPPVTASVPSTPEHTDFIPRSDIHLYSFDFEQQQASKQLSTLKNVSRPTNLTSLSPAWTLVASTTSVRMGSGTRLVSGDISIDYSIVFSSRNSPKAGDQHQSLKPGPLEPKSSTPTPAFFDDSKSISGIGCQIFCHANGFSIGEKEKLRLKLVSHCMHTTVSVGLQAVDVFNKVCTFYFILYPGCR